MKIFTRFALVAVVLSAQVAIGKSGSEFLAEAEKQEKELRSGASLFSKSPDFTSVIATYTEALDSGTLSKMEQIRALVNRAGLYAEQQQCPRAVEDLNKAFDLGHQSARTYALRGSCHARAQAYEAAVKDFDKAVSLRPKDAVLKRERGVLFFEMKDFRRAAADLGEAIRLLKPSESSDLHVLRGDAYQQQGEHQRAIDDYLIAVRIIKKHEKELGVPTAGAQMAQLRPIYAKIGDSYHALSRAPESSKSKR